MTRPDSTVASDERGFILVGVVMFMLALTILGLSLFALSSYEAQFFYSSVSREQSLQSSESGIELVKALVIGSRTLDSAHLAVGQFGVTQAIAYQQRSANANDTTSRGPVNWDSTLVIAVAARTGGEERTVQSRFVPSTVKNPYRQLISAGQGVTANGTPSSLELQGPVLQLMQTVSDTAWTARVSWPVGRPLDTSAAPSPLANTFVDTASTGAPSSIQLNSAPYSIRMHNAALTPRFYRLPANSSPGNNRGDKAFGYYEFFCDEDLVVHVHGTCVWILPRGVCFNEKVSVQVDGTNDPANPNLLVIAARPNTFDPGHTNRGIWFRGGIEVTDPGVAKVFLVSEGDITVGKDNVTTSDVIAKALTVVAGGMVELTGPTNGSALHLAHTSAMDALADQLLANGALPPTTGGNTALKFARGSWLETRLP